VEELPPEKDEVPDGLSEEENLSIVMNQVDFRYNNGDIVLHPFDFSAKNGELIAITGPSGEGKTTLLRLILGLVEPCAGEALVVGDSGNQYPISAGTRGVFAYVPQGNSVFAGTIAQNLRLVAPEATDQELEQALKIACAYDFVSQLPMGLNHHLGAGGRGISEGQAQRLAIARALLRKAPILLLDEATSALDVDTERQLMDNLRSSGIINTCVLVTHRPSSASFCNRAYEIRNGFCREVIHEG
jgi:ABC-type bacteriocin/lantibiotic exporter with double-glycine peptidase domain